MDKNKNYITILIESLEKKEYLLDEIISLNEKQCASVLGDEIDDDAFNFTIEKKEECIKKIEELDNGFEKVYSHIREEIMSNKEQYAKEIEILRRHITNITEKSMEIQLGEKRNEQAVMKALNNERNNIKQSRMSSRAASDYYKNMNRINYVDPQFMDKKK